MAEVVYTEGFIEDMAVVERAEKRAEILRVVALLADIPHLGSNNLPDSIRERFSSSVRKLAIEPFPVIYEFDESNDTVYAYGLIRQRKAR